jgi:LacI family transcriptional regulator
MTALSSSMTAGETRWERTDMAGTKRRTARVQHPIHDYHYVTLQDVAARAGVSAKTVSRVVNQQGEISDSTRKRIQAAIDELGYRPNILARSLIHSRSHTLGAVAWGIDYFGPSRTVIGVEQQAEQLGYSLFLTLVRDPDSHDHKRILDTLLSRRVDGIIWAVPEVGQNREWFTSEAVKDLPPMIFLSMAARPGARIVAVNNRDGGRMAVEHLIGRGRKRIGILTGPLAWWEACERLAGWKIALQQAHLNPAESLVVDCDWSAADGERAMQQLLAREPELDGVFAGSDQIGLGAMSAIAASGRRVPEDIALVGFDNLPESQYFRPSLTTVRQNLVEVGRSAVQRLDQAISSPQDAPASANGGMTVIEPELIVRDSSG